MPENIPADPEPGKSPAVKWDKVKVEKSYWLEIENVDIPERDADGNLVFDADGGVKIAQEGVTKKFIIKITGKDENETTDGSPGARIRSYQFESK